LVGSLDDFAGAKSGRERSEALPRVAIVGEPNAGKSTLFNALLGRARAVASPVAGTTRDVLAETIDLSQAAPGAGEVLLQDLPGLDNAGTSAIDVMSQRAARDAVQEADALVWCDPLGRFDERELALASTVPTLRVRTFGDRPTPANQVDGSQIAVCALDGWRLDTLRRALADLACGSRADSLAALLPRHRRAMSMARESLALAAASVDRKAHALSSPELVAGHLRSALDALGELVGQISPDDVIGRVFATFCVGK
jgi:tRNA modification GTPase